MRARRTAEGSRSAHDVPRLTIPFVEAFENKLLLGEAETKRVATLTQLLLKWAAADADPAQQQDDS